MFIPFVMYGNSWNNKFRNFICYYKCTQLSLFKPLKHIYIYNINQHLLSIRNISSSNMTACLLILCNTTYLSPALVTLFFIIMVLHDSDGIRTFDIYLQQPLSWVKNKNEHSSFHQSIQILILSIPACVSIPGTKQKFPI